MSTEPFSPELNDTIAGLLAAPERYDFFAALRQLEALTPDQPRLGEARRADDESMRLAQPPFVIFPPSQIATVEVLPGGRLRVAQYMFGLFGPQGPLPLHVTVHALQRARQLQDPTLTHFADIFHHRLLSLFYRAWARAQPAVEHDRPQSDRFVRRLAALCGTPGQEFAGRDALPDAFCWHVAGLMAMQTRSPERLQRVIALFFQVPVRIEEFIHGFLDIPLRIQARIGVASTLGTTHMGPRVAARHHRFRIVLGPLDRQSFESFLPYGALRPKLTSLVRRCIGLDLEWDVQLVLERSEVPAAHLDRDARLDWTSWLSFPARKANADEVIFDCSDA